MTDLRHSELIATVQSWISQDPDPQTSLELGTLLQEHTSGDTQATGRLQGLFSGRLAFGTAGIRGPVGPGPQGMNRVVVSQTTAGLAQFLLQSRKPIKGDVFTVVVGCDARTNSDVFWNDTLEVLSGYGIHAIGLPIQLPTPVLAFAVRHLDADAGVMVTASHNPPQDNGYKVYLGGVDAGSQIIPPVDREIEALITTIATETTFHEIPRSRTHIVSAPDDIVDSYVADTVAAIAPTVPTSPLSVVYTPLHGVGAETFLEAVSAAGFSAPHVVAEQQKPDAAFPTVAFPNPEDKGALDLSFALATSVTADVILANDPDADRLAVALPDPHSPSGYTPLTGNQLGAILGWQAASRARDLGVSGSLAISLVSSPVLGRIAEHFGLDHHETLTGFKYVSRVPNLIFGFEEALGYLVTPSVVRDKDGISAALAIITLAHHLAAEGKTLQDYLHTIEEKVGAFASSQITIRRQADATGPTLGDLLRKNPPGTIGTRALARLDDFLEGFESYPPEDIIRYYLSDGSRVIVRPSGTEPKVKIYLDTSGETRADAESALAGLEKAVRGLLDSVHLKL
jgi:phosphomannomutase